MAMDLGVFGRNISWTKKDKVLLWEEINRLYDRGLTVERHEQPIEEWFVREKIQEMRKSVEEKRRKVFKVWRTDDLRIQKYLPPKMRHIEHQEREVIVRMMRRAVLELKHHRNLVQSRKHQLKRICPMLEKDLQTFNSLKTPAMGVLATRSYVKFQDASTLFKAAQYVNISYKKVINVLMQENLLAKGELQRLQRDSAEMKSLTVEMKIFHEKSLNQLAFFSHEFERRYGALQVALESHRELLALQQSHATHNIEQEIQPISRRSGRETIADLEIRVEEVEREIRSLQNATRCPELRGIEARLERQLPDADSFMADAKRLREARVSLIARRKEIQRQHDRYEQDTNAEFRSLDQTIDDLRQKIEIQRQRQFKHCQEVEELSKHKTQFISHLNALKFSLNRVKSSEDEPAILRDEIEAEEDQGIENYDEAKKLLKGIWKKSKILVKQFDFNLSEKEVMTYEHLHQDKILDEISPRSNFNKLDHMLKEAEMNFAETLGNVKFDTSDVPTRKDIKRMSHVIVVKNQMD